MSNDGLCFPFSSFYVSLFSALTIPSLAYYQDL